MRTCCRLRWRAGDTVEIVFDGRRLELPTTFSATGKADLVLRPHQIRLTRDAAANTLPAEVSYAADLGNQIQYTLTTALGEVFAITQPSANPFRRGETVHLGFELATVRLVAE